MTRLLLPILLLLAILPGAAPAQNAGVDFFEYGYFCALEPVRREDAPGTVSGDVNMVEGNPIFIGPGPNVPAQIGIGMGVNIRMKPGSGGPVVIEVEHPPMGPRRVTRQIWQTRVSEVDASYVGYSFDYPYELLPGRWILSARANGRQVYTVTFNVVPARQMPWINCGEQVPLS